MKKKHVCRVALPPRGGWGLDLTFHCPEPWVVEKEGKVEAGATGRPSCWAQNWENHRKTMGKMVVSWDLNGNCLGMKVSRKITDFYGPFSSKPCLITLWGMGKLMGKSWDNQEKSWKRDMKIHYHKEHDLENASLGNPSIAPYYPSIIL